MTTPSRRAACLARLLGRQAAAQNQRAAWPACISSIGLVFASANPGGAARLGWVARRCLCRQVAAGRKFRARPPTFVVVEFASGLTDWEDTA